MTRFLTGFYILIALQATAQWSQLPGPFGGQVLGFYQEGTELFASTDDGIFRSSDNGHFWTRHPLNLPDDLTYSQIIYKKDSVLFLLIGQNASYRYFLYRSSDGGATFEEQFDSTYYLGIVELGDTLYLARGYWYNTTSRRTFMKSFDQGKTWIDMPSPGDNMVHLASDGRRLYAITYDYDVKLYQLWRSTDAGFTWDTLRGQPPLDTNAAGYRPNTIDVVAGSTDTTLWVGYVQLSTNLNLPTIYYVKQNEDSLHAIEWIIDKRVEDIRHSSKFLYVNISGLFLRYSFAEQQWVDITYNLRDVVFHNWIGAVLPVRRGATEHLLVSAQSTGRGIVRLDGINEQYTSSDSGLTLTYITALLSARDTLYTACFSQDKLLFYSTDQGQRWHAIEYTPEDAVSITAMQHTAHGILFAESNSLGIIEGGKVRKSGLFQGVNIGHFFRIEDSIYLRTNEAYFLSTDEGQSWQERSKPSRNAQLVIGTGRRGVVLCGGERVWRSTDGALTWEQATGLPKIVDTKVALGTGGVNMFAAIRFNSNSTQCIGIFRSTNLGVSWQLVSPYLSGDINLYSSTILIIDNLLLCGTAKGVLIGNADKDRWTEHPLGKGGGYHLTYDDENVYVGTLKSGIWKASIAGLKGLASVHEAPTHPLLPLVTVFPNPTTGNLLLDVDASYASIEILDLTGRVVLRSAFQESYDVHRLSSGVYHVNLLASDRTLVGQAKFTKD